MPEKENPINDEGWLGNLQTMKEEGAESDKTIWKGNSSGQGSTSIIPPEIKGWNWGAFFFGWLWGVPNKVWISLLSAIPYAGVIMCIVLGFKGNEWAWQHKEWYGVEHFKSTQKTWAWWGLGISVFYIIFFIVVFAYSS